jgi:hypothetical protein
VPLQSVNAVSVHENSSDVANTAAAKVRLGSSPVRSIRETGASAPSNEATEPALPKDDIGSRLPLKAPEPAAASQSPEPSAEEKENENRPLKLIIRPPVAEARPDYVIQQAEGNALKITLKAGPAVRDEEKHDGGGLKLKLVLPKKKHEKKKEHRKKKKDLPPAPLILRIKSPEPKPTSPHLSHVASAASDHSPHPLSETACSQHEQECDKAPTITQELRVCVRTADNMSGPNSACFAAADRASTASSGMAMGDDDEEEEDDSLGLAEGTFNDLMKVIDASDDEVDKPSAVEPSQVDGSADALSRRPSPHQLEDVLPKPVSVLAAPKKKVAAAALNIIQQRMKQTSGNLKPKSKFALIRHVFSTYTKNRKIVAVKYRKPESRLLPLDEYLERLADGTLDEPYDEDNEPVPRKKPEAPESESSDSTSSEPPAKKARTDVLREQRAASEDIADAAEASESSGGDPLVCGVCSRRFPNAVRLHLHKSVHADEARKKTKTSSRKQPHPQKRRESESSMDDHILQLDGHDDDFLMQLDGQTDLERNASGDGAPLTSVATTATAAGSSQSTSTGNGNGLGGGTQVIITSGPSSGLLLSAQNPTHVVVLKKSPVGVAPQKTSMPLPTIMTLKQDAGTLFLSRPPPALPSLQQPTLTTHPMLIKQDPVLHVDDHEDSDLILPDHLHFFEGIDPASDAAIHLSLDDIASFAQPMTSGGNAASDVDSFLSGNDALDVMSETTNGTISGSVSIPEIRSESGTPSLPDEGEFPCTQCDKKVSRVENGNGHSYAIVKSKYFQRCAIYASNRKSISNAKKELSA